MGIAYITTGSSDIVRSRRFYDAVMPHLGGELHKDYPDSFCYRFANEQCVWVLPPHNGEPQVAANGSMPGFECISAEAVRAAHAAALAHGGSNEGDPGLRPQYRPNFFGGYVRDPDGNKMCFVWYGD